MHTPDELTHEHTRGIAHPDLERVITLLEAAGHLNAADRDSARSFGPALSAALRRYQAYRRLPPTGWLDAHTLHSLSTAVRFDAEPDISPNAALRAPGEPAGFVPHGTKWTTRRLRYTFVNDAADLGVEQYRAAIRCALQLWSEVAPLTFVEASDPATAELRFGFFTGNHGDSGMFDGRYTAATGTGKILGHAPYPPPADPNSGDVHFDEAETWTVTPQRLADQPFDLMMVALHEIGHALGLEHSGDPSAVMFAYGPSVRMGLSLDDIRGIRYVYQDFGYGATNPAPLPKFRGQSFVLGDYRRLDLAHKGVRADVFFRGADGHLRQLSFTGATSGGNEIWNGADHGIAIKGLPLVYVRGNREQKLYPEQQRFNVFAVGADGHLLCRYWNGLRGSTADFGGNLQPGLVAFGRGNFASVDDGAVRIVVVGVTVDGHLVDMYWDGRQWSSHDHGGLVNPGIAVMGYGDHSQLDAGLVRTSMFLTRMGDNHLIERFWDGGQWLWTDHGGSVTGTPAVLLRGDQSLVDATRLRASVFSRGTDGQLWERYWNGAAWNWIDHPGQIVAGDPLVIGRGNLDSVDEHAIRINVFVHGADGQLLARTWNGQAWTWADMGGTLSEAPLQWIGHGNFCSVENGQIRLRILAHGVNNHLIEYHWNTASWEYYDLGAGLSGAGITPQLLTPLFQGASASPDDLAARLRLFALSTDGTMAYRRWEGGGSFWVPLP